MQNRINNSKGFNYIELVITFIILAGLAAIAIPAYKSYARRMHFKDVVQVTSAYKDAVEACYKNSKKLAGCNGGQHGIHANITKPKGPIASVKVVAGVISVVPAPNDGVTAQDTYVLTPVVDKGNLVWTSSGGAVADGFAD